MSTKTAALGSLRFDFTNPENNEQSSLASLTTSEVSAMLRFAPNEQFVQGKQFRLPMFNKYPVFTLRFAAGFDGLLGGDYDYQRLSLNIFKRFYLSIFGITDVELEEAKSLATAYPTSCSTCPCQPDLRLPKALLQPDELPRIRQRCIRQLENRAFFQWLYFQ